MTRGLSIILSLILSISVCAQLPHLDLVQVASGFTSPVDIKNCGDGRIFEVEQAGRIRIMDKHGNINATPFLDIHGHVLSTGNEQGLLGLAFSPNYKQDGYFYVNYVTVSGNGSTVISRFQVSPGDSNLVDSSSERVLLTFAQPFTNHKGGNLMFGPDGYLYDTQGDGGSGGDPLRNGQNKNVFLGKMLRLDVSDTSGTYVIPATNPFAGDTGVKQEIWAYGLRNPWRCSFDKFTGDLWIADVGQSLWEEIDFQPPADTGGQNYGWNCYEGNHVYNAACNPPGVTFPIFEYGHSTPNGCAVIGGYVYRGAQYANLFGKYLFTDFCSGRFWDIRQTSAGVFAVDTLQSFLRNQYGTFGEDNNNELYISGRANGNIYRITDTSTCNPVAFISFQDTISHCDTVQLTALTGDSLSFQWYDVNGPVGSATTNQFTVTHSGWYKVMVSKPQAGCSTMSDSVYADVHHDDLTICNCPLLFCNDTVPFSLNHFFTPSGGVYSGRGVANDSILSPSIAGIGSDTLLYTYTSTFGCVTSSTLILQLGDTTHLLLSLLSYPEICDTTVAFSLYHVVVPSGGVYSGVGVTNDSIFNAAVGGIGNDTIYYLYTDSNGCSSHMKLLVIVDHCTGINEITNDLVFSIFPNPGNGLFNINASINAQQTITMTIVDILGRVCLEKSVMMSPPTANMAIDLHTFSKGVYTVQLKGTNGSVVKQLVIE